MSTIDSYKQVLFNDGEGLVHTDLNNLQRYLEAKIWGQIIHNQMGITQISSTLRDPQMGGQDGTNHSTALAYTLNPGSAFLRQGSANNKVQIAPGTLLQKLGTLDGGDTTEIVSYTFAGSEEWTITNGDATNCRVDLLQMQLTYVNWDQESRDIQDGSTHIVTSQIVNKQQRTQCTLSVKSGTPAASPRVPDPDPGCVAVGFVLVQNGYGAANPLIFTGDTGTGLFQAVVYDCRMPVSVKAYTVDPKMFHNGAAWTIDATTNDFWTPSSGTNSIYVPAAYSGIGRLVAIEVCHQDAVSAPLSGLSLGFSAGPTASYSTSNSFSPVNSSTSNMLRDVVHWFTFEQNHAPALGPTILASNVNKIGVPIWGNGRRCPMEQIRTASNPTDQTLSRLTMKVTNTTFSAGAAKLGQVTFYFAEGL
jgi:hypothetical protein